jgi:hypothetical protein
VGRNKSAIVQLETGSHEIVGIILLAANPATKCRMNMAFHYNRSNVAPTQSVKIDTAQITNCFSVVLAKCEAAPLLATYEALPRQNLSVLFERATQLHLDFVLPDTAIFALG